MPLGCKVSPIALSRLPKVGYSSPTAGGKELMERTGWYVLDGPQSVGPLTEEDIVQGYQQGRLTDSTQVWAPNENKWLALRVVLNTATLLPPPLPLYSPPNSTESATDEGNWVSSPPYAWRRYFARQVDILFLGLACWFLVAMGLAVWNEEAYSAILSFSEDPAAQIPMGIIITVLSVICSAIILGLSGRTFGKLLFGIRVLAQDGRPIGVRAAFKRELTVLFRGLGFAIPIVSLVASVFGYQHLKANGVSSWDTMINSNVSYRRPSAAHWVLVFLGASLSAIFVTWLIVLGNAQ